MNRFALCLVPLLSLLGRTAAAQPSPLPTPPPAVAPSSVEPLVEERSGPLEASPAAQEAEVSQETQADFEAANSALLANNFDRAIELFENISESTSNSEVRGAAQAMAILAKRLKTDNAIITIGGAHGGTLASPDREGGRTSFVITTTLAAFYSSFAVTDILGVDDFTPITLTVAATTAAGLGLSLYATRNTPMHPALASAYSTGLFAGVANGLLIAPTLGIDVDGEVGDGDVNQNYLLFGLSTMAAGGALGYVLARDHTPTAAQVTTTTTAGLAGFASIGLGLAIVQPDDIEGETLSLLLAAGLDAGLLGGALLTRDIDWSPSRANYVALSQFLGALGGFTAGAIVVGEPDGDDDGRIYAGLVLTGIWAGLLGGIHVTRDMAPDSSLAAKPTTTVSLAPLLGENLKGFALGGQF